MTENKEKKIGFKDLSPGLRAVVAFAAVQLVWFVLAVVAAIVVYFI